MNEIIFFENLETIENFEDDYYGIREKLEEKGWEVVFDEEGICAFIRRPGSSLVLRFDLEWLADNFEQPGEKLVEYIPDFMLLEQILEYPYLANRKMGSVRFFREMIPALKHFRDPGFRDIISALQGERIEWEYDGSEDEYDFWDNSDEITEEEDQANEALANAIEERLKEIGLSQVSISMEKPSVKMWIAEEGYPVAIGLRVDYLDNLAPDENLYYETQVATSIATVLDEMHFMKAFMEMNEDKHIGGHLAGLYEFIKDSDGMQAVIDSVKENM